MTDPKLPDDVCDGAFTAMYEPAFAAYSTV